MNEKNAWLDYTEQDEKELEQTARLTVCFSTREKQKESAWKNW